MKLNPYKIGMNFYIILIVFTLTLLGCKTFEKWDGERKIKNEVEQMFQTPDLTGNKK
jgi:high-affinity Fe2+/Pb2+ permease